MKEKAKILKVTEWDVLEKRWYVADTTTHTGWWEIPRMLEMELTDYIKMLIEKYNADIRFFKEYEDKKNSLLCFCFYKYQDAHMFLLDVNRIARQKQYKVVCPW